MRDDKIDKIFLRYAKRKTSLAFLLLVIRARQIPITSSEQYNCRHLDNLCVCLSVAFIKATTELYHNSIDLSASNGARQHEEIVQGEKTFKTSLKSI